MFTVEVLHLSFSCFIKDPFKSKMSDFRQNILLNRISNKKARRSKTPSFSPDLAKVLQ